MSMTCQIKSIIRLNKWKLVDDACQWVIRCLITIKMLDSGCGWGGGGGSSQRCLKWGGVDEGRGLLVNFSRKNLKEGG